MHIRNLRLDGLQIDELVTRPGESWCIFGRNRSGIDHLVDLFAGCPLHVSADILQLPRHPGLLSFRIQQEIFEEELRNDDTDILDRIDPGTPVRDFIPEYAVHLPLLKTFGMDQTLEVGYRQLSSGQCRKLILLRELTGGAKTLILQNPYDGLDELSCHELDQALRLLPDQGIELILTVNTLNDIPFWCTHLAVINSGSLVHAGPREKVLPSISGSTETEPSDHPVLSDIYFPQTTPQDHLEEVLIYLQKGSAGYNDKTLFSGLDLKVCSGDHTLITGPNGCGKSTLLDMITGDNPRCYTSDLKVFGKKRGSGESIWDLKRHMGIVSPGLHRDHRVPGSALSVVLSGFFDSIGLYKQVGRAEISTGLHWLDWIGLRDKADAPFRRLPFAEQRLVLIARALIKRPKLLILDEPTQGLDDMHRYALLDLLEKIADQQLSTLLFVSHRRDEQRPFFRRHIRLDDYAPR
jgi:molybdate transport system ATP-binding protein